MLSSGHHGEDLLLSWLKPSAPWILVAASPSLPGIRDVTVDAVRSWLPEEVAAWPAPIPFGAGPVVAFGDTIVVRPEQPAPPIPAGTGPPGGNRSIGDQRVSGHLGLFGPGSSAGCALQIATRRPGPAGGGEVWALGEGALAWSTAVLLRLAAVHAERSGGLGPAAVTIRLVPGAGSAPIEIWNHAGGANGPIGRLDPTGPVAGRITIDLASCLAAGLGPATRQLVLTVLDRFGVTDSRHFDGSGRIRSRAFTGHAPAVEAWARTIGLELAGS